MADCFWGTLPPELVSRIVLILSPNEVACIIRLINKSLANQLKGWVSVRLSQPVPHHAFVRRWGNESGVHGLSLKQRQQLLCLTARSGVVANLEVAVAAVGCRLTHQVLSAAAEGGHVVVCVWLLDRGCPLNAFEAIRCGVLACHTAVVRWALTQFPEGTDDVALIAAASAGQRALCEELLAAAEPESIVDAACEAAVYGHVELTEWLLGQLVDPIDALDEGELLGFAACGFELPALQRLYHSRLGSEAPAEFIGTYGDDLTAAALTSPTPDWRAKLEWLEAVGCRLEEDQRWDGITEREDAVERVTLLQERNLLDAGDCLQSAIDNSSSPVVRYLRNEGLLTGALEGLRTLDTAMRVGDVAVLVELLAAGDAIGPDEVNTAAHQGHLHVLRWLEGPEAGAAAVAALQEALQNAVLAESGARSGSLELMEWLWERGCPSNDERVFTAAAGAGNVALLERLLARGCPMSCYAYLKAGSNGDLLTLRCLRRLDCPWGPGCNTFDRAVYEDGQLCCRLEVLRWLVAEGCPVDWQSARVQAQTPGVTTDVVAWIESHMPQG